MSPSNEEADRHGWQVPAFVMETYSPKATRYVVVIPVVNEGERIRSQIRAMHRFGVMREVDVVIVDGGSTDGSVEAGFLREHGVRALLTKTGQGKLSAQLRCGYCWALLEGYAGIITIDGNGKDGIETIPDFIRSLDEGYDYVQASRFLKGGEALNTPISRTLAIRLVHAPVLSCAARRWLTDTTQGYRAYSTRYLRDPHVQPFRDVFIGYELLAYLTVRAGQLGYRVRELPTRRVYPSAGAVPTKIEGMTALLDLLWIVFKAAFGGFHPDRPKG